MEKNSTGKSKMVLEKRGKMWYNNLWRLCKGNLDRTRQPITKEAMMSEVARFRGNSDGVCPVLNRAVKSYRKRGSHAELKLKCPDARKTNEIQ